MVEVSRTTPKHGGDFAVCLAGEGQTTSTASETRREAAITRGKLASCATLFEHPSHRAFGAILVRLGVKRGCPSRKGRHLHGV